MLFLLIGKDGTDEGAHDRRMAARPEHLVLCGEMHEQGKALLGFALVDDKEQMNGSAMLMDFPDRAALDAWLKDEPYVVNKVWQAVEVSACRVGPAFQPALEMIKAR